MKQEINSKALEVNLSETQKIKVEIPEKQLWFLSLSKNYYGINQRTSDFLKELNHPYFNSKIIVDGLVKILNDEFWVYKELDEKEKVYDVLFDIFRDLLEKNISDKYTKSIVQNYLQFFSNNFDDIKSLKNGIEHFIKILDEEMESNLFAYLSNISFFRTCLKKAVDNESSKELVFNFTKQLLLNNVEFWESTTKIEEWYESVKNKFSKDYSSTIYEIGKKFYNYYKEKLNQANDYNELTKYSFTFSEIIESLRNRIVDFEEATDQFVYIFFLLHLPGTIFHRDYILVDLNKAIKRISSECSTTQCINSIDILYSLFADFKYSNTSFILDSILTLGKEIINTKNKELIHYFEEKTILFGFINPGVAYLTNDWELKVNPNHIKNIRVWQELIAYDPFTMKKLLSSLIINLRIGGIFIFDTDLFQKDISKFLNSNISPIYKQVKQLLRIYPVYFNEIGAEGQLRDVTTVVDELTNRNDKLIHFLRKQIHTEGSNSHIDITLEIIKFWYTKDKSLLESIVPENVFVTIDPDGQWVDGVHKVLVKLCKLNNSSLEELINLDKNSLQAHLNSFPDPDCKDCQRVALMIELYHLLREKYLFSTNNLGALLSKYHYIEQDTINSLLEYIEAGNHFEALKTIYSIMKILNDRILDEKQSEAWENIYYKRHIAFGIPSMYGQYHEEKFEAMGLTFRLEQIASSLVDRILDEIKTDYFTARTLKDVFLVLQLIREGLTLDGIYDQGLDSNLKMLQYSLSSESFTIRQYINIFQFMEKNLKEIINNYFIRPYENQLPVIIPSYLDKEDRKNKHTVRKLIIQHSEVFYRDLLSSAFLVQSFDAFIGRVLNKLRKMADTLSDVEVQNIMSYNPDSVISPIYRETLEIDNQVFLGSKAYYLKKLYLNDFPVPPGFVITTEVFRRLNSIMKIQSLYDEIENLIRYHISELERLTGLEYGNPEKPLLMSVRSGAAISMPGAMNTFLNVGMNDEITEALSKKDNYPWTSWDCYRRLLQTWGMAYGLDRNDFDNIMLEYKAKYDIQRKIDFNPKIMREIAFAYKKHLEDNNITFESDPFKQIMQAVLSVFNSWDSARAKVYREHMQIADEWGTAVIIQQMIFGNLHKESGSGVLFTHDTQDNIPGINLTGDFSFLSQGEDIVAGLINTLPISENQRKRYYHNSPISLESGFPKIYNKLKEISYDLIENHGFAHQEIEFTFEHTEPEDLYILQTRSMIINKQDKVEVFATLEKNMELVGTGIGIGNRVLNGRVVFDLKDLKLLKEKYPEDNAMLVRPDTVPDDIELIFECEGLLTGKGGATSHAAVTAGGLGKVCVVNCADMLVYENEKKAVIRDVEFRSLDLIAIDGIKGNVYKGNYPLKTQNLF